MTVPAPRLTGEPTKGTRVARPYCQKKPAIVNGIVDVGDWITPNDITTRPYRFFLRYELEGQGTVKETVYPDQGESARIAPTGKVRVWMTAQNNPELGDGGEKGATMYLGGEYTEIPAVSDWTQAEEPSPDWQALALADVREGLRLLVSSAAYKRVKAENPNRFVDTNLGRCEAKLRSAESHLK
jgi:hypothetical protein